MVEDLKIYLLGPPYVTWNNSKVEIPRRQVRALLYCLANYPYAIPQERLHYLFWSDKPEAICRRNLSHLITHLRGALPDENIVIVNDSLIMLNHERVWCDVGEFKSLLRTSKESNQYQAFQQANELYRGPFLDGMQLPGVREFEYLIERERFSLERNYLNLLYKLMLIEKSRGDFEAAIEYAYQYLSIDELSEEVHRQLITLFALTGKRERAFAQYKICEEILMEELQAKPSGRTRAAYQEAISGELLDEKKDTARGVAHAIRPVKDNPTYISKEYLDQLNNLVNRGERNPWGIAMVCGELGIGKSSLLTKYLAKFEKEHLILRTKCNPGTPSIRYWPFRQICSAASKSNHPALQNNNGPLSDIKNCMLRLSDDFLMTEDTNSFGALTREYYFSEILKIIFGLADAAGSLMLCFEDLEWADEDTLNLILYLCSYLREKNLLILGSYCCEENTDLKKFIHNVQSADDFLGIITLQGVDLDTTAAIVKYWLGDIKDARLLAEKFHRVSGGNPFFLSEILRWIVESEIPVAELLQTDSIPLPTSISAVVGFRLGRLKEIEMKVLETAATIGYSFDFDQIFELTELPRMQIFDALDELVIRHLLVNQASIYQFRHELIYQSVLKTMSPARKQFLERCMSDPRYA